ncbi:SMF2 [Candida jiufengensis]|uniref:SMF2 n=1 Tax=Candida jiufengensis TaxID=497108 RepID=UPI0022255EEC|nr:SMF2 [Candida jiufengensis]KAI5954545.1 SMF2 [Candida jiufengensis]
MSISITNIIRSCSIRCILSKLKKYSKFIGPGLMVSVAFLDPGNYSTAVSAGSAYKYNLLFSIFLSNCLAIFLQTLAAKLGAVTGLDLAANCKEHFEFKTNLVLYIMTEIAIIATDLAEVVGTAIALNILFKIPLFLGVIVTVIDVLIVLAAYRPKGPLLFIRIFESFVSILVAATVVCFGIQLYQVSHDSSINFSVIEVFKGFLPNEDVINMSEREGGNGLYLSLAILGATVMPHSLYLGSGLVQSRLKDFDIKNGHYIPWNKDKNQSEISIQNSEFTISDESPEENDLTPEATPYNPEFEKDGDDITLEDDEEEDHYRPSIHAIKDTMSYTIIELVISLFTVALFVNSAILIVAGATLNSPKMHDSRDDHDDGNDSDSDNDDDYQNADLFTIYHLLTKHLSPTAGFVFALALLCSGQSAGVVCTLAGQMVSEGFLSWSLPPITRRLITRGLAIAPCLFVVTFAGREGLAKTLNASQVVLSLLLPIVSAPLIYFTCNKKTMRVPILVRDGDEEVDILFDSNDENGEYIPNKFIVSEPAIRLQDLRNSHPCAGWEEDEEDELHQNHNLNEENRRLMADESGAYFKSQSTMKSRSNSVTQLTNEISGNSSISSSTNRSPIINNVETTTSSSNDIYRIKGYKDFSNSTLTSVCAILIWTFITILNLYLVFSMSLDI